MGTKAVPFQQPCVEVAIQIGQAMSAIEAVSRSNWESKGKCLDTLQGHLGNLQNQYEKNCSGGNQSSKP